jgi:hypothetical protein
VNAVYDIEQRERFFERLRADLERLHADPQAWADYQAEIRSMDGTLADGLVENPWNETTEEENAPHSNGV